MPDHEANEPLSNAPAAAPWERRVALVVAFLLIVFGAGYAWWQYLAPQNLDIPNDTLTPDEVQDVVRILDGFVVHEEVAEAFAEQYGTDALGILVPVMRDRKESTSKRGRAAYIIGKYRQPEYTQDIINFINQALQPAMGSSGLAGLAYAVEALGWAGDEKAIRALKTLAGKAFWEQREKAPYKLELEDAPRIQRLIRQRAVIALGRAPEGAGIPALKELAASAPDLRDTIDKALSDSRLSRWGLAD